MGKYYTAVEATKELRVRNQLQASYRFNTVRTSLSAASGLGTLKPRMSSAYLESGSGLHYSGDDWFFILGNAVMRAVGEGLIKRSRPTGSLTPIDILHVGGTTGTICLFSGLDNHIGKLDTSDLTTGDDTWTSFNGWDGNNVTDGRIIATGTALIAVVKTGAGTTSEIRRTTTLNLSADWTSIAVPSDWYNFANATPVQLSRSPDTGTIIAVPSGGDRVLRSTNDGVSWTTPTIPNGGRYGIAAGNGRWVIGGPGTGSEVLVSLDDGVTWLSVDWAGPPIQSNVVFANGRFYGDTGYTIISSADGVTWEHASSYTGGIGASCVGVSSSGQVAHLKVQSSWTNLGGGVEERLMLRTTGWLPDGAVL
jgi:hypothetical protein